MQHPPVSWSPRTWSALAQLFCLRTPSPVLLTLLPGRTLPQQDLLLKGEQVPAVQSHWHTALPRRITGYSSPPPGVGPLFAREKTQRELFPQKFTGYSAIRRDRRTEVVAVTSPNPLGCLMVTCSRIMTLRKLWQLRPNSGGRR